MVELVQGVVALGAGWNNETNLPWAEGIINAPLRVAAWRQELAVSILLFFSGLSAERRLRVEARVTDEENLSTESAETTDLAGGSAHHCSHHRLGFRIPLSGAYLLTIRARFDEQPWIVWERSLLIEREA